MHSQRASTTPIFADGSGRRVAVVQWTARAFCLVCIGVAVAVAFTLTTHVPLPGLDRILSPRTAPEVGRTATEGTATAGRILVAGLPSAGTDRVRTPSAVASPSAATIEATRSTARKAQGRVAQSVRQPRATESAAPVPAGPTATARPNPPAQAKTDTPANPHAVARGTNSSVRAAPQATKTANPTAEAARTKPRTSTVPQTKPVGSTQ